MSAAKTHVRKDICYFSHDSNAKDDPKCVLLIEQLGLEGYGIFWVLVETLREQPEFKYPLKLIPALARRYNTTTEKMKTVVSAYDLFLIENDTFFFSQSLNRRMDLYLDKRKRLSEAGKKGNEKRWNIAKPSPCDSIAIANKEKEIKENTLFESSVEETNFLNTVPPNDGVKRNWEGLKRHLLKFGGETAEINLIVELSNYGEINHVIWKLLQEVQNSNGKIHSPIAFLLSKLSK